MSQRGYHFVTIDISTSCHDVCGTTSLKENGIVAIHSDFASVIIAMAVFYVGCATEYSNDIDRSQL